jgi:cobalamin biosynthesis protein CbiG
MSKVNSDNNTKYLSKALKARAEKTRPNAAQDMPADLITLIREHWKHGDMQRMADEYGMHRRTFAAALRTKKATPPVAKCFRDFYTPIKVK